MSTIHRALPLLVLLGACTTTSTITGPVSAAPDAEAAALDALLGPQGLVLGTGSSGVILRGAHRDGLGQWHVRARQLHRGVPVFGAEAIVHLGPDGAVAGLTDGFVRGLDVDPTVDLSAEDAAGRASAAALGGAGSAAPETELVVLRHEGRDALAWQVQLAQLAGPHPTRPVVFVDAHSGAIAWSYENLQSATCTGETNYYGNVTFGCDEGGSRYWLEDSTELVATTSFHGGYSGRRSVGSPDAAFDTTLPQHRNALEARWAIGQTNAFYADIFGRDGIDGAGGPTVPTHGADFIMGATSYGMAVVNAYWDGSMMLFGDGDGVWSGPLTTLDVAGHELTHGVTEATAGLIYAGESGHLNESMSDVFGGMVERYALGDSEDVWLLAEAAWTPGTDGDALRYMNDPAADGVSYDDYTSGIERADVHYGSGVPNLVFYLLSEGGTHPRGKTTHEVVGIGADAAQAVWYLALTSYMTPSTDFSDARDATVQAATDLYGAGSVAVASVTNAWAAVHVGDPVETPDAGDTGDTGEAGDTGDTGEVEDSGDSGDSGDTGAAGCAERVSMDSLSGPDDVVFVPSKDGVDLPAGTHEVSMTGPSDVDFDVHLEVRDGADWSDAGKAPGPTAVESFEADGEAGTYRLRVQSWRGDGLFAVSWCQPQE